MLVGDQIRLKQVLINLTKNALKFTSRGEISIRASYDQIKGALLVSVKDTGRGIAPEQMSKLFKAFSKLPQKEAGVNQEGVGMGLAICRKII